MFFFFMAIFISFSLGETLEEAHNQTAHNQTTSIQSILDSIDWFLAAIIGNSVLILTYSCGILIYCWKRFATLIKNSNKINF